MMQTTGCLTAPRPHLSRRLRGALGAVRSLPAVAGLLAMAWLPAGVNSRVQSCAQPSDVGCPIEVGQRISAVLADPADVHTWVLRPQPGGDLVIALTDLPADYDLYVYGPDGRLFGESRNEGTRDDVVLLHGTSAGEYRIYVNAGRSEAAPIPYTLGVLGSGAPAEGPVASSGGRETAVSSGAGLLRADDFSDPLRGLFLDNQRGTNRGTFLSGTPREYRWGYGYQQGALVARIDGPYTENPGNEHQSWVAEASDAMFEDFAAEVRAQAGLSPTVAQYALQYLAPGPAPRPVYQFAVRPANGFFQIWYSVDRINLASGRSTVVNRGYDENQLRIEVRGDTMTGIANGRMIARARHDGLATRGGTIRLGWSMYGPPEDGDVEVRFRDFRVFALAP